jgi:alpha-L-rhamnosidase
MGLEGQMRDHSAAGKDLQRPEFTALMIAPGCDAGTGGPGSYVARDFTLDAVLPGSLLHLSAQGLYRAFLNGQRVGADLLTPGWTCYDDRIAYQTYDVTALLRPGANRIEIWLGDGWYRSRLMWALNPIPNTWGDRIGAFAELVAGGRTVLRTDAGWRSGLTPVTGNGIYHGEDYDARIAIADTHGVEVLPFDTGLLVPQEADPVAEMDPVAAVAHWPDGQSTVYDLARTAGPMSGWRSRVRRAPMSASSFPKCWARIACSTTATSALPAPSSIIS